jgi:hypothetical protein
LTSVTPPGDGTSAGIPKNYVYSYDAMGRLNGLTENSCQTLAQSGTSCTTYATNGPTVATAAYGPAGEITGLSSVAFSNETPGAPEHFTYLYNYNTAGGVPTRRLQLSTGNTIVNLDPAYLGAVLPGLAEVSIQKLAGLTPAAWAARAK